MQYVINNAQQYKTEGFRFYVFTLVIIGVVLMLFHPSTSSAYSTYFYSQCASCHNNDSLTCNGCHYHGNRSLYTTTDKTFYSPGEEVTVTFYGGTLYGWIRSMLKDHDTTEIARRTGPTFTGNDGGQSIEFPVQMKGFAPGTKGYHQWKAVYYGHTGTSHMPAEIPVQVQVESDASVTVNVTPDDSPPYLPPGGGILPCTIEVENTTSSKVDFDVWIDVTLPWGDQYGPVEGPIHAQLPRGIRVSRKIQNNVPKKAPAGVYSFNVYVGNFNEEIIYDADSFSFIKEPKE
jgi:hypothetical protein